MMNILSIDTSTQILSIALKTEATYEERLVDGNFAHSEDLLFEIESLLDRAKISLKDLNLLICTRGPGSFTGLRVGMATLKGFSSALSIPLVSIPTLEAIEKSASLYSGPILSVIDAKKKRFYLRLADKDEIIIGDRDGNPNDIIPYIDNNKTTLVTGPDCALFAKRIWEIAPNARIVVDNYAPRNLSKALIEIGIERLNNQGADDIGQGPVYIRRSDAEEALIAKMEEENK